MTNYRFLSKYDDNIDAEFRMRYRISFERSMLKKEKLAFLIIDPKEPLEEEYVASYKAQLLLKGEKYTDAYKQQDFSLEERSKRKDVDLLETLYYIVKPKQKFKDLVVNETTRNQLHIGLTRAKTQKEFLKNNKLTKQIPYGQGVTINFRGVPGTGKTMAAHCFANELQKELLIVRYDQVQSMWVGETEKHIQQIFKLASVKNAVLFFDEADALAHDRSGLEKSWEMSQVNTLLKELERYEGVCIFATNFAEKYDKAFERRLTMHIDFPAPKKEESTIILQKLLPPRMRANNLDLNKLPLEGLTGGLLKNVVLNALGMAALEGKDKVENNHLKEALKMIKKEEQQEQQELYYIG